ncbi:unnamed protein product, partial [Vitis vinifera]
MVAWPLYAEQHMNKVALVEVMKMAIRVEQRDEDMFVSGAERKKQEDESDGFGSLERWGFIHHRPCQIG